MTMTVQVGRHFLNCCRKNIFKKLLSYSVVISQSFWVLKQKSMPTQACAERGADVAGLPAEPEGGQAAAEDRVAARVAGVIPALLELLPGLQLGSARFPAYVFSWIPPLDRGLQFRQLRCLLFHSSS